MLVNICLKHPNNQIFTILRWVNRAWGVRVFYENPDFSKQGGRGSGGPLGPDSLHLNIKSRFQVKNPGIGNPDYIFVNIG